MKTWLAWGVALLSMSVVNTAAPAMAAPEDVALLESYIGSWQGQGALVGGDEPEPFRCRLSIDRITQDIKQSAEGLLTYRNSDSGTCIRDDHVPLESLGCTQHDAAHDALPHLLCHLHDTAFSMIIYF